MNYSPSTMTADVARAQLHDMLRVAEASRVFAALPAPGRRHTPRRRVAWWIRSTARVARA